MFVWILLIAIAGLGVVTVGLRKFHRFKYRHTVIPVAQLVALEGDGWELQQRMTGDGVSLVGLMRPPPEGKSEWVLFLPGNGGNLLAAHQGALNGLFAGDGRGLSFWAYRGFDASQGWPSPELADCDALEAFELLTSNEGVSAQDVHLVGYSLGSCVASRLAAKLATRGTPAASLTLIAYADGIRVMERGWLGSWKPGELYDSVGVAKDIPAPVLLLHGTSDGQLKLSEGEALRGALSKKAKRVDVEGADHTSILGSEETIKVLAEFLGR